MKLKINPFASRQELFESLIIKILYSKRLLVEHVDALEVCMSITDRSMQSATTVSHHKWDREVKSVKTDNLLWPETTAGKFCLFIGAAFELLPHLPRPIRVTLRPCLLVAGGFSAVCLLKNIFCFRKNWFEIELENLIHAIIDFENCIRCNMAYFNEIEIIKRQEFLESHQMNHAWDCITATKVVTEILFEATRKLEAQFPIPPIFSYYYAPMEDIKECEYFKTNVTSFNPKQIKDFHQIFAYVQSQFLLRLALTISTKPSLSQLNKELTKIICLIKKLVLEEDNRFKNIAIDLNKKQSLELEALNAMKVMKTMNYPVNVLQDSSLKLSSCMVALACECHALNITLQKLTATENKKKDNTKQLVEVANNMQSIENAFKICFDDFQKLMLVYNKYINIQQDLKSIQNENNGIESQPIDDEFPDSLLRVEISQTPNDTWTSDDFYAYVYNAELAKKEKDQLAKEQSEARTAELEILNFKSRFYKTKFRPVLKQLKDRIDPIRQVMLEKEREVLATKGINVDEFFADDEDEKNEQEHYGSMEFPRPYSDSGSDTSESSITNLQLGKHIKKIKKPDNFAEMRNLLAQKQNINLFKLDIPPSASNALGGEDILESEC